MASQKKSSKSSTTVKSVAKPSQKPKKSTALAISHESIKKAAYLLSLEQKKYDDWIWLAAEADLIERKGLKPNEAEIRFVAEEIGKKRLSLQDLHWMVAEKRLIYQAKLSNMK